MDAGAFCMNTTCKFIPKETFRSMTLTVPPRDWTDIDWPDVADGAAARWIAVLPLAATEQHGPHLPLGTDVMIGEAYLGAGARAFTCRAAGDVPAAATGRDFHRAYRFSGHADLADRRRAEELDGARRKRGARRHPETGDGHQPRRQQRGDDPGRAGSARAIRTSRGHHEHGRASARRRDCFQRRNCATAFMAARSRRRSCWRVIRNRFAARTSPTFVPPALRWKKNIAGFRRIGRRRSHGRRRIFTPAARSAMRRWLPPRKGLRLIDHGARAFCELLEDVDKFDVKTLSRRPERSTLSS